ncbi:MAG: lysophospholipid acyltransferase family protein [Candidatus Omnitrophica bacterium]|nr:lysophospholipid acyltransferase family protein [Candidatus Omnitrophota bacterium]
MNVVYLFFFYLFLGLVRILPAWIYFPLARAGVRVFYVINVKAERYALETLDRAYGEAITPAEKKRLARVSFLNLADGLAGFIFSFSRPAFSKRFFDFEGLEKVSPAVAQGKGVIIGVSHFGPFAWMMYRFIAEGYRVSVVAKPPRGEFLKKKFQESARHAGGLKVILSTPVRACVAESLRSIESGELLFMPLDQNYGAAGRLFVNFFGYPAATAPGPVMYAARTKAPLLMAFALPEGKDKFKIVIEGPLGLVATGDERADLAANTQMFTAMVERYVRQYPEQWSWMHRRWKCVPRENELK